MSGPETSLMATAVSKLLSRNRLFPIGLILIERVLADISAGRIVKIPQAEAVATWEPALNPPRLFRPELPQLSADGEFGRIVVVSELDRAIEHVN